MQHTMHSYVCGQKDLSFCQIYILRKIGVQDIRQEHVYRAKSKYNLMRILFDLVFIPQTQESIGYCMTFPDF